MKTATNCLLVTTAACVLGGGWLLWHRAAAPAMPQHSAGLPLRAVHDGTAAPSPAAP